MMLQGPLCVRTGQNVGMWRPGFRSTSTLILQSFSDHNVASAKRRTDDTQSKRERDTWKLKTSGESPLIGGDGFCCSYLQSVRT